MEALAEFLPLSKDNWIICGNALELDWVVLCPPVGSGVKLLGDDLFTTPLDQAQIDFKNAGGEVYICGNPPYRGSTWQSKEQKADVQRVFGKRTKKWKSLDYVCGWFMKAADYCKYAPATAAFVTTNSICQGEHVPILWPLIFNNGCEIAFAHTSFKWANLAAHNAGVTVAIIGISKQAPNPRRLFELDENGETTERECANINAYLVAGANVIVESARRPLGQQAEMSFGNKPTDGGHLLMSPAEVEKLELTQEQAARFIRPIYGSAEFIRGLRRYCLWIKDEDVAEALAIPTIAQRIEKVRQMRLASNKSATVNAATTAYSFAEIRQTGNEIAIIIPAISSENRPYLPVGLLAEGSIISNLAFAIYDAPLWNLALIASRLHLVWIGAVCGKLKTDFRYSNTIGWNTFPIPFLTSKNKEDLTRCAEDILLAQDAHFPATIADLYAEGQMPADLMAAHGRNDEVVERIFVGRRCKNDSERLEQLFATYARMVAEQRKELK